MDTASQGQYYGQNQRVGLLEMADPKISDAQKYWSTIGVNTNVSRIHKHYVLGSQQFDNKVAKKRFNQNDLLNQAEVTLDLQQAGAVAPQADIDLYLVPSMNAEQGDDAEFYQGFARAIGDNKVGQISTSFAVGQDGDTTWGGQSESAAQFATVTEPLFAQAAAQGIGVFSAAGDRGAYTVNSSKPSLSQPTSSFLTSVGGTTLPLHTILNGRLINIDQETAWNNKYYMSFSALKTGINPVGGTGGFSKYIKMPPYQAAVPGTNTFRAIQLLKFHSKTQKYTVNQTPKVITGTNSHRAYPDISANSDTNTGYAMYLTGKLKTKRGVSNFSRWFINGGTSFASPQTAATSAVLGSAIGGRVGFWNPQIYQFATSNQSPFTVLSDVTSQNLYYTGQPGKLYNQATGLGTVDYGKLLTSFKNAK
ncbi:S8 family serine peptidase [uncultured Secundilactobacillus sp.]|uniref:S53 family peptidase n=1 Tax=uncultured Secundilactobacillus sp. TaxID=2813935 RepID=UPI00258C11F9|nr:S53 family peptidase [uncultured Secundilactobacillus sp.]